MIMSICSAGFISKRCGHFPTGPPSLKREMLSATVVTADNCCSLPSATFICLFTDVIISHDTIKVTLYIISAMDNYQ